MSKITKEYWDTRAEQYGGSNSVTTNDFYLRELEVSTIIQTLHEIAIPKDGVFLDVGCGDGYSTLKVVQAMSDLRCLGIDYSENMIGIARERLESEPALKNRVSFIIGDATELGQVCGDSLYDVIISDRCLINLESFDSQSLAIAQIANHTKPGGYYIAIENFVEGHENMNSARRAVGVSEIPIRWHNLFFKEREFVHSVGRFFEDITFKDFSSSYYFATRVIYSAMCNMRGEDPDYNHEIHQLGGKLLRFGQFSPIRMAVMRRKPCRGD